MENFAKSECFALYFPMWWWKLSNFKWIFWLIFNWFFTHLYFLRNWINFLMHFLMYFSIKFSSIFFLIEILQFLLQFLFLNFVREIYMNFLMRIWNSFFLKYLNILGNFWIEFSMLLFWRWDGKLDVVFECICEWIFRCIFDRLFNAFIDLYFYGNFDDFL